MKFIEDLKAKLSDEDDAIDFIYDKMFHIKEEDLAEIDRICEQMCRAISIWPDSIILSVLTATLPYRSRLLYINQLFYTYENYVDSIGRNEPGLLDGLEPQ